jgi:hypothetical protein
MVAGIPGTGIGGLFYIILAFSMPLREAYLTVTGKGTSLKRWLQCFLQVVHGGGILGGLYGIGWVLAYILQLIQVSLVQHDIGKINFLQVAQGTSNLISGVTAYLAIVTLVTLVLVVELISLLVVRPGGSASRAVLAKPESAEQV